MRQKTQNHFLKFSIHLSVKISGEKLQTNIWKILSKHLEKFKHSTGPQNLLVKSFAVRFTEIISHQILIQTLYSHTFAYTRQHGVENRDHERSIDRFSLSGPVKVEKTVAGSILLFRHHDIREKRSSPLFCLD